MCPLAIDVYLPNCTTHLALAVYGSIESPFERVGFILCFSCMLHVPSSLSALALLLVPGVDKDTWPLPAFAVALARRSGPGFSSRSTVQRYHGRRSTSGCFDKPGNDSCGEEGEAQCLQKEAREPGVVVWPRCESLGLSAIAASSQSMVAQQLRGGTRAQQVSATGQAKREENHRRLFCRGLREDPANLKSMQRSAGEK